MAEVMLVYQYRDWPTFTWDTRLVQQSLDDVYGSRNLLQRGWCPCRVLTGHGVLALVEDIVFGWRQRFTEDCLVRWHTAILGSRQFCGFEPGMFRTDKNSRMRINSYENGKKQVCYVAPEANKISSEMDLFFEWMNRDNVLDGYVKTALAVLWFLTIHPFPDGNGRIARALAERMLSRAEHSGYRRYSLSFQILKEKREYGKALYDAQHGTLDVTEWIVWFLGCLSRAMRDAPRNRSIEDVIRLDTRAILLHR